MQKLIIEASINESARKEDNPNIPYGPEEGARDGIACAKAGAAIIHYHARDQVTGDNEWENGTKTYLECYRLIRQECPDVIVYPTQRGYTLDLVPHLFELARDAEEGLELATVDVFPTGGYTKDDSSVMVALMQKLREHNVAYSLGVRDIGHMRHIARYRDMGLIGDTLILKIFWNERSVGPPPDIARIADVPRHGPVRRDRAMVQHRVRRRPRAGYVAPHQHAGGGIRRAHPHRHRREPDARRSRGPAGLHQRRPRGDGR